MTRRNGGELEVRGNLRREYDEILSPLALDALSSAPEDWYFWLPLMAEVRRAPEFRSIVRELGLVEYWQAYTWADFCRPLGEADFECR